jgi:hypothetical protein
MHARGMSAVGRVDDAGRIFFVHHGHRRIVSAEYSRPQFYSQQAELAEGTRSIAAVPSASPLHADRDWGKPAGVFKL